MSTAELTCYGMKQPLNLKKLLFLPHLFHLYSQLKTGVMELLPWMVAQSGTPILYQLSTDAEKLPTMILRSLWILLIHFPKNWRHGMRKPRMLLTISWDMIRLSNTIMVLLIFWNSEKHSQKSILGTMLNQLVLLQAVLIFYMLITKQSHGQCRCKAEKMAKQLWIMLKDTLLKDWLNGPMTTRSSKNIQQLDNTSDHFSTILLEAQKKLTKQSFKIKM